MSSSACARLAFPALFLVLVGLHAGYTMDDAFIAFRYSDHLARGLGLVWNPGEDPVEGYTSFAWVVLNALSIRCGLDPVVFSKVLGTACGLATIGVCMWASRGLSLGVAGIFLGVLAASPQFALLTVQGLETPLAALCILLASSRSLAFVREPSGRNGAVWYATALLAALTRPDTIPFTAGLFLGMLALLLARRERARLGVFLALGAAFAVLGGAYFAWRLRYFGWAFPNPYYVKMNAEAVSEEQAGRGLEYTLSFLRRLALPYAAGLVVLLARRSAPRERLVQCVPILVASVAFGAYVLTITPIQGYCWRFLFPVVPALCLAGIHLSSAQRFAASRRARLVLGSAALLLVAWNLRFLPETLRETELRSAKDRILVGRALAGLTGTMFTSASGATPYYSRWRSFDKLGLNSEQIAHHGLSVETLAAIDPDLVVVKSDERGAYRADQRKNLEVQRYMVQRGTFVALCAIHRDRGTHMYYFARRDSPLFDEVARRLLGLEGVQHGDLSALMPPGRIPIFDPEAAGSTRRLERERRRGAGGEPR